MKRAHRDYSLEFKKKAVELSYARGSLKQICEELDIPIGAKSLAKRVKRLRKEQFFRSRQAKISFNKNRRLKRGLKIKFNNLY